MLMAPSHPRSLRENFARKERRTLLDEPHIAPLRDFVAALRAQFTDWEFPDFDPLDGGVDAECLFLFEKPGPMTSEKGGGSGFISRDNDDPTAEATFCFMRQAKIDRRRSVIWNAIPGWNGERRISQPELRMGIESLAALLALLRRIHTVVLVGKRAQGARGQLARPGLRIFESAHPSPLVKARWPEVWRKIPEQWAAAAEHVTGM
ncbi:MAG: uracil-DNA glycosylase [Hyphomicrobiales bacterium]|nr:uracil-DNA glycosylase [Hyphomicrobiales bacterium]